MIERMNEADRIKSTDRWLKERSDLLDRIKVLEGELVEAKKAKCFPNSGWIGPKTHARQINHLKSLLHRCLNTGLRDDKKRPIYLEVCRVLGVDPDKPWEEK